MKGFSYLTRAPHTTGQRGTKLARGLVTVDIPVPGHFSDSEYAIPTWQLAGPGEEGQTEFGSSGRGSGLSVRFPYSKG